MLASINPLGERSRNSRFAITVSAYLGGSVAGGAAVGALLGLVGEGVRLVAPWNAAVTGAAVAGVGAAAIVLDSGAFGLRVPTVRRQVNEDMLNEYREWVYGLVFGFQLGLGVVTIVTTATVYAAFLLAFLTGAWEAGLIVGATFGLARAVPILLVSRIGEPHQLRRLVQRMESWVPIARRASLVLLLVTVGVAVVAAGRTDFLG